MIKSLHFEPKIRKKQILESAIRLAIKLGYQNITRNAVADEAGIARGLVNRYFKTMPLLKRAVMKAAIEQEVIEIIAQGLGAKDQDALKASEKLKKQAVDLMLK